MTHPRGTFIELHTWETPHYDHNRATGHWAAPLERQGIKRVSQGQHLPSERMKDVHDLSFWTSIRLLSSLLLILFGAFMDKAAHQEPRVHLFFFVKTPSFSALYSKPLGVCAGRHPAEWKITMQRMSLSGNRTSHCCECFKRGSGFRLPGPTDLNSEEHEGIKPYSSAVIWLGTKAGR